ncbi:DUF1634 domain-containing protein [Calothrix sp. 336/3]|uniref:DUF1634 domain-containing protein n=1 Tax=Calothrix sp. 336/3 TaxID=1337936 RepID=UPI0004E3A245|nr:DUF1634 domain-containing protein [Calothrix sp. 336/3]AKG20633.1 hypothetical protein IJ00_04245 [Calothrix sp. 336/3]
MGNFDLLWRSLSPAYSKSRVDIFPVQVEEVDSEVEELKQRAKNTDSLIGINRDFIKTENEEQLENLLSNLLKYGVLLASAVVLFGGIIYLVHQWHQPAKYSFFRGEPEQFSSPMGVVKAVFVDGDSLKEALHERAIIQFGLLLLVATPILRVIISLFAFIRMQNFIYVVITLLVLTCLGYSLLGAYI